MRRARTILLAFAGLALGLALVFLSMEPIEPVASPAARDVAVAPEPAPPAPPDEPVAAPAAAKADSEFPEDALVPGQYGYDNDFRTDYPEGYWQSARIEEIREALYARQIDRVERLYLLDDLVETGDRDPRDLWGTDWGSADDFKDEENGFSLLKGEDGRFYFVPDAGTMRQNSLLEPLGAYDYHEDGGIFVQETEYYGKPMMSALKFLRDDVVVMMIVSGDKVDLNLYGQAQE